MGSFIFQLRFQFKIFILNRYKIIIFTAFVEFLCTTCVFQFNIQSFSYILDIIFRV